jgi:hypothetical protein
VSVPDVKRAPNRTGSGRGLQSKGAPKKPVIHTDNRERMLFFCVFFLYFYVFYWYNSFTVSSCFTWSFATGDIIGFSWLFEALVKVWQLLLGLYGQDLLTDFELFFG